MDRINCPRPRRPRAVVYVAGPLSDGLRLGWFTVAWNALKAARVGLHLMRQCLAPIVPHLWALIPGNSDGISYETWMQADFALLERCDIVLRLPGDSEGADREVRFAKQRGIPVAYNVPDLLCMLRDPMDLTMNEEAFMRP